jgi:hypothetical protein
VTIVYLPEEEDAKETKQMVKSEGRKCGLVALDLKDSEAAKKKSSMTMSALLGA